MKRRDFVHKTLIASAGLCTAGSFASQHDLSFTIHSRPKISLAQWSLHRAFEQSVIKAEDFASIAREQFQIEAVEYVNSFYRDLGNNQKFWNEMKRRADEAGVKSLLIMVDNEGDLGDPDATRRQKAVENHYKWIEAARALGCHSIRVNAFGTGQKEVLRSSLIDGLGNLTEYAAQLDISVLIENHGLHTSDASFIVDLIKSIDNSYLGTLPDFGNWCLNAEWGSTQNGKCTEVYDPYQGLSEMLPFAKGVSAKSYDFDKKGDETSINYAKMLKMVKDAKFKGYIGIEYEGQRLGEEEGITATKKLIKKVWRPH